MSFSVRGESYQFTDQTKVDVINVKDVPELGSVYGPVGQQGDVLRYKLMRLIDIPQLYLNQHINPECRNPMGLWQTLQSLDFLMSRDEIVCIVFFA